MAIRPTDLHAQHDDFGQPGTLIREVWNDTQRADLVDNVAGHLLRCHGLGRSRRHSTTGRAVDSDTGTQIEE